MLIGWGDSDRLALRRRGNDLINARERGRATGDLADCGAGRDTVLTDNTERRIANNCELIRRGFSRAGFIRGVTEVSGGALRGPRLSLCP